MARLFKFVFLGITSLASMPVFAMGQTPDTDPAVVSEVDFKELSGIWFQIGHEPNSAQKNCIRSIVEYGILSPDTIEIKNLCYGIDNKSSERVGKATIKDLSIPAKLKLKFANPLKIEDYWILDLDQGYEWAVISGPKKKTLRILAREAPMERDLLNAILQRLQERGFNVERLVFDQYH